jgi:hypothetical protein
MKFPLPQIQEPGGAKEMFLTRRELATRWGCHVETVKRMETRYKQLVPVRLTGKFVKYRLTDIQTIERGPQLTPTKRRGFLADKAQKQEAGV